MEEQIESLSKHYILCGMGRTGIEIVRQFVKTGTPFVVVEQNAEVLEQLQSRVEQLLFIEGDAAEDESLEAANIKTAAGLITTLKDDKDNIFVVLTARSLNPRLRIVARVNDEHENTAKLYKAGANAVIPHNVIGGLSMASEMIRPEVIHLLDKVLYTTDKEKRLRFTEIRVEEITALPADQGMIRVADIGRYTRLLVMAIKREGKYIYKPAGDTLLQPSTVTRSGDILVVVATQESLDKATGA